jgi:GNAT superfamily N-acetyltransferase
MFKLELRKAFIQGSVYTLGGDFQEVAIWKHKVGPESDLAYLYYTRPGTLKLLFHLRLRECIRLFKALRNVSNAKLSLNLPANAVELYIVGVNPANQGQGRLSRLLKPVLEVMHEQERPVLVMTNTESNKAIYEHLGFKLVKVLNDKDADCISYYLVK